MTSELAPATCTPAQGQSSDDDEHLEAKVTTVGCAPCTFYVVVHGWDGAANDYDIRIGLE